MESILREMDTFIWTYYQGLGERDVTKLVEIIYIGAEELFKTKCPTASIYLHNNLELRVSLKSESTSSDGFVKALAIKMLKKLDEYWKDTFLLLAVATVMDPRCKDIEISSKKYEGRAGNSQATSVMEAVQSLFADYASRNLKENDSSDVPSSDSSDSDSEDEE